MEKNVTLGFAQILREALKIPFKNPYFVIFTFLSSLPLFFSLFMYEIIYPKTISEASKAFQETLEPKCMLFCFDSETLGAAARLIGRFSHNFLLLVISHLGILHFFDLFNTIATVNSASYIYGGDKALNLREMFMKHIFDSRLRVPFITSIYVLLLSSLISIGLISLALYVYISIIINSSSTVLFMTMFLALLAKYLEWSVIWDIGTVISIVEERDGDVALVVSAAVSRNKRLFGCILVFAGFVWRFWMRVLCLHIGWNGERARILIIMLNVGLVCLWNVFKWVVFVVYFNECKKWSSVTEVDEEVGHEGMPS